VRVRYDQFKLPKWLKPGKNRFLDDEVVTRVYRRLGIGKTKPKAPRAKRQRRKA
jgi:hypothetical protein